ncbi:MAG: signal peptidase I [Parachlamydia sp.]|nr:MAG: signal peptidase I [Parachlamydia sp.]
MKQGYADYQKKRKTLSPDQLGNFERNLEKLDQALLSKNRDEADAYARQVESFCEAHFKKSWLSYGLELFFALAFALLAATVIRQMWFEPFEIPTGSMRPTFKEQDHVTVSKTAFGINVPLQSAHFMFDPKLVQRSSIFIFSPDNMPIKDTETTYFGIFPYKKRYIKRLIGKPGDSIYFYGGKIYAIDEQGTLNEDLLNASWMQNLEYIPFLQFEGQSKVVGQNQVIFSIMNQPLGRISISNQGTMRGEIHINEGWVKDNPLAQRTPHEQLETYSDFYGLRNFATARLLTKDEVKKFTTIDPTQVGEGILYLELRHTPSLTPPAGRVFAPDTPLSQLINVHTTVIPLQLHHLNTLMDHMYTGRFIIKDGRGRRLADAHPSAGNPFFKGVPDGTYEFYYGKGLSVGFGGITSAIPENSSLYERTPENIQKLFNLGIEMDTHFAPSAKNQRYYPNRYAYFRDGNLYALGGLLLDKDDPVLQDFVKNEQKREAESSERLPYIAFKDYGPPLKDGKVDTAFIRTFGVKVPAKQYLGLGDNHAMSADSRVFGFIPENNIQGAPWLIVWPTGERWGPPPQKPYPFVNLPGSIVWGAVLTILGIWYWLHRRGLKKPIFRKLP